jgi:hypothetical protein
MLRIIYSRSLEEIGGKVETTRRIKEAIAEAKLSMYIGLLCQIMTFANAGRLPQKPPRSLLKNWVALRTKLRATALRRNFIRYEVRVLATLYVIVIVIGSHVCGV